jgi:hypothetical protein
MYNGKRIDKWHMPKQLRMDEELAKKIRKCAEEHERDLQREVPYLIKLGLREAERIDALIAQHGKVA